MPEDLIVTQIGLIFSQVRYIRMALDQVERSTARYAGVALEVAAAGPGRWGAPPLESGALRVFVVNLTDLIQDDNSVFGVLSTVVRGALGAVGGLVGGVLTGIAWPVILAELAAITANVVQILQLLGLTGKSSHPAASATVQAQPEQSGTLGGLLVNLENTGHYMADILGLANDQQRTGRASQTESSRTMLQTMQIVSHIMEGLILLIPVVVGAFASLLVRIDQLKVGILDLLEFVMRNVLLLRGIVLVTLFDTIATAAHLAGQLLAILTTSVGSILAGLFRMLEAAIAGVFTAIQFLSSAITAMINAVLPWLVTTVFVILEGLGRLPIFRLMFAFVEIMPTLLAALARLTGHTVDSAALIAARERMIAGLSSGSSSTPPIPPLPDFANLSGVQSAFASAGTAISGVTSTMQREITGVLGTASGMMNRIGNTVDSAVGPGGANLTRNLEAAAGSVTRNAEQLTQSLRTAREAARPTGGSDLQAISDAYTTWLSGDGLRHILESITRYFQTSAGHGTPEEQQRSPLGRAVEAAQPMEPARPTVEIAEVVVEIRAAAAEQPVDGARRPGRQHHSSIDPEVEIPPEELFARGFVPPAYA